MRRGYEPGLRWRETGGRSRVFVVVDRWRAYILKRDAGLCVRCGAPGAIVHHKRHLTPGNIDDPLVCTVSLLLCEAHGGECYLVSLYAYMIARPKGKFLYTLFSISVIRR